MTLDLQPVSLETLAQFSSLIIEAAHWLEREGKTLWNTLELTPEAVLERYRLDELFLTTLEGGAVGTVVGTVGSGGAGAGATAAGTPAAGAGTGTAGCAAGVVAGS